MITVFGVIFFISGAYCFLFAEDSLLGLLLIATVFEGASAIDIGDRGIQPYYIVACFVIMRGLINWALGLSIKRMQYGAWLLVFGVVAVGSAFISPVLFAGIPIYDPKIGIDPGLFIRPPLKFGYNNVIQASYLSVHIAAAFAILAIRFSPAKFRKWYLAAFYIEAFIVFAESACQLLGITFPLSLFVNNPGYTSWDVTMSSNGIRNPGTFAEPSLAGAFLILFSIGFLANYLEGKDSITKTIIGVTTSLLIASSSSLLSLLVFLLILIVRHKPFRLPWHVSLGKLKRILLILTLIVVPLVFAIVFSSNYRDALMGLTLDKSESGSFVNRTASDLYAIQLVLQTYGIGVGLGSSRTSSFVGTLFSNVGLVGGVSLGVFYVKIFNSLPKKYEWYKWAGLAFMLNMAIGLADITLPMLWCSIFIAISLSTPQVYSDPKVTGSHLTLAGA
jgi:hypothetical protein